MQYKTVIIFCFLLLFSHLMSAQTVVNPDTVVNPEIDYMEPKEYQIADIQVEGAESYDDFVLIGFSGLQVGQKIVIPGDDITNAVKKLITSAISPLTVYNLTLISFSAFN